MWLATAIYISLLVVGLAVWMIVLRQSSATSRARQDPIVSRVVQRRLFRGMQTAFGNGEIFLAYQPKLRLRSGEIEGVEALVRWDHPGLGSIPLRSLIPLAEARGHIHELTIWVLRQALLDHAKLAEAGHALTIHINVSASLLTDTQFVRDVCALVGGQADAIGLEITETALIENSPEALVNLERMIAHGVTISIDDYGSGLSSLAYLKELPAKELKIDKMFVSGMTLSHRDPLIVRSTIDLAHALDMTVVAEGVESMAVLALLRVMGCDHAQGFLISPALTRSELVAYLEAGSYRQLLAEASTSVRPPTGFWARVRRDENAAVPGAPEPIVASVG